MEGTKVRLTLAAALSAAVLLAIVGCSSAPAATPTLAPGTTPAPTQAPGTTPAPAQVPGGPTQAPVGVTGHECDAVPTFDLSNPNPATPAPDPELIAHFPAQIDGQPVTDVESMQWLYFMCLFGGQEAFNQAASDPDGLNFATMSFGSAKATVDGEEVDLSAWRTPGNDANSIVQSLALLAAQTGNGTTPGSVTTSNVGGKNVYVWTDEDGAQGYAYVSGDTLIMFNDVTESQATKILAALP
jgi:hypothetical protein